MQTSNSSPAVTVQDLRKSYGEPQAANGISLEVQHGEIFGIIGANGSGKTTTVECLQGLRKRDGGDVRVLGLDPQTDRAELRHRIGSQLQESALPERMRVWEALDLFGSLSPRSRPWQELVSEWGLVEKQRAAFANLSGGQRQRLLVALALVNEPEIVFLDEMTTGLDPAARRAAWELVRQVRERGSTVVLVTHFMDEAEALCDRIAVFRSGRVVDVATPGELISRHAGHSTVHFTVDADLPWLSERPGVEAVSREGARYRVRGHGPLLALVAAALVEKGYAPEDLGVERATLEDVYLKLSDATQGEDR